MDSNTIAMLFETLINYPNRVVSMQILPRNLKISNLSKGGNTMETKSKGGKISEMLNEEFQGLFKNIKFPAKRNDIVNQLREEKVSPEILQDIGMIPDKEYSSADEIMTAYKESVAKAAR